MKTSVLKAVAALVALTVMTCPVDAKSRTGAAGHRDVAVNDGDLRIAVNTKFDHIFADMRQDIANSGLDPLPLASDEDFFTVTLFNQSMNGSVWVGDGSVRGLGTIHRTGNMSLDYGLLDNELIVAGEVGLTGLEVTYSTRTEVGLMGSHFTFIFGFPYLSVNFKTDVFISQANLTLEYCFIEDFSYSHLDLKGVGPADTPVYMLLVNMLLQLLNDGVQAAVETEVCDLIHQAVTGSASVLF
ncbi:uncharacterized protein LOC108673320 [Hyalella azteca]|uniref:Uncharacterized protein LOC108673320 n=1 Tax=Hyalella azteca TaxID=294128 RepID=A0A8B7NS87_HYAAZ|nr:uncharacterized protein LOC108673320 [Hyalella azteca]XP_047740252.1 uncharacterized protein LOC108673320 [Hyalella azteca]